jgi:hypothetical protein
MVRKYEKMGYYNLAKPEFISEVITTFTNLELSSNWSYVAVSSELVKTALKKIQNDSTNFTVMLIIQFYARVGTSLTCGKHLIDRTT